MTAGDQPERPISDIWNRWAHPPRAASTAAVGVINDCGPQEEEPPRELAERQSAPFRAEQEQRYPSLAPSAALDHWVEHLAVSRDQGPNVSLAQFFEEGGIERSAADAELGERSHATDRSSTRSAENRNQAIAVFVDG